MSRCVLTELVVLLSGGFANRLLDAADSASSDVSKLVVLDCLRHTRLVHEIFRLLGSLLGTLSSGLLGGLGRLARRLHVRVLEGFGYIAELPLTPRTATSGGVATSRDPQLQCFAAPPDRNDRTVRDGQDGRTVGDGRDGRDGRQRFGANIASRPLRPPMAS